MSQAPKYTRLPMELTNGNDGQQKAWQKSSRVRRTMECNLRLLRLVFTPRKGKVTVTVVRILGPGQRLWDSSSRGRGNYKQLEDSMVACGWFTDDSPKYIKDTIFQEDDTQRENGPAIDIYLTDVP
jgi:hypothetical protein